MSPTPAHHDWQVTHKPTQRLHSQVDISTTTHNTEPTPQTTMSQLHDQVIVNSSSRPSSSTQDWFMMTGDLIINLRSTKTGDQSKLNQSNLVKRDTFTKKKVKDKDKLEDNEIEHKDGEKENINMIEVESRVENKEEEPDQAECDLANKDKHEMLTSTGNSNSSSGNSSCLVDDGSQCSELASPNSDKPANDRDLSDDSSFYYEHFDEKQEQEHCYENIVECNDFLRKSHESNLYSLVNEKVSSASDDSDDDTSLSSFKYTSGRVNFHDPPCASRLAKRLYNLEGFRKFDVAHHLCKNNGFSRLVAEEYLRLFDFSNQRLDEALRGFLSRFHLTGETQEQERVLVYFSKRYKECNPTFELKSEDSIHTLVCALMLLNTDLQEKNIQRKMTCIDFIMNLARMNDGEDYPVALLKNLFYSIKRLPLSHEHDEIFDEKRERNVFSKITTITKSIGSPSTTLTSNNVTLHRNSFVELPNPNFAIEYKKGYIRRKCCFESNGRPTRGWNRSWKMFYATLRDLVLYCHKDENGFRKSQSTECYANSIRINHSIALIAKDYTKRKFVFRLITSDCAEFLFETSDSKELQSWVDAINTTAASLSAPALPTAVSSDNCKSGRDFYPVSHTKLSLADQLKDHESKLVSLQKELETLLDKSVKGSTNSKYQKAFMETEYYLQHEIQRYRTYIACVKRKLQSLEEQCYACVPEEYGIYSRNESSSSSSSLNAIRVDTTTTTPHSES